MVAGQTWHWVDPVAGARKAAEVLRSAGVVSMFWNVEQPPEELGAAFADVYGRVTPKSIHARRWAMRDADPYAPLRATTIAGLHESRGFHELREHSVEWTVRYTRDTWLDQLPTQGGHAQLPAVTLAAISRGIGDAIDDMGGEFTVLGTATSVTARRTPRSW